MKIIFNETSQVFKTRIPKSRRAELERVLEPLFNRVPLTGKYATYDKIIEADGESTLGCFMLRKKRREGGTVLLAYSCAHHKGSWLRHGEEEVKENPREYVVETEPNDAEIEPEIITLNGRRITVSQQS
ncbi:hypothetical protein EPN87_02395 [archaeon]|nr:MAG: hypothetical protein EPN87_02395 [archaeon]